MTACRTLPLVIVAGLLLAAAASAVARPIHYGAVVDAALNECDRLHRK